MENPVQTLMTTVRITSSNEEKISFEILDGPFEGVTYNIMTNGLMVEKDLLTFDYSITNPSVFEQQAKKMFERIIQGDMFKRLEEMAKKVDKDTELLNER